MEYPGINYPVNYSKFFQEFQNNVYINKDTNTF